MPCAFITPITISIIPAITNHLTLKNTADARETEESAVRVMALISMPCAFGLATLAEPVTALLGGYKGENLALATSLMAVLGISIMFNAVVLVSTAIMQAHGHVNRPVVNMFIGGLVKLAVVFLLTGNPAIGIVGTPIGTLLCYLVITVLNVTSIRTLIDNPPSILKNMLRPFAAAAIMGAVLQVKNILIGIESNKPDAIAALSAASENTPVKVEVLQVRYPQGSEKQLIYALTGRCVPSGGLPADAGCVVQNAASAAAVSDAVLLGIPLIERIVTVTGEVVKNPGNFRMRIGTPLIEAVKWAGGVTEEPGKLILGGPMMGFAQRSFEVPVSKNSSGILLLSVEQALNFTSSPCIRCGRCVEACPMKLEPCLLCSAVEGKRFDLAQKGHVMDCLECGACAYVCPSHRPLVQHFRRAKAEIRKNQKRN
jgi:ferredoxin